MIQTELDQQRADQSAQTQAQSITPINIGSPTVDASGWKSFFDKWNSYAQGIPKVDAPSESDIRDGMWESSFVVALLAGLATGNAAAGITGGLWAAIAVHDEGYARRDRAQYVTQLYTQGISAPAIMQWYETGDTKILEQEKDRIQREADHKDELEMQNERMKQQDDQFNKRMDMDNRRMGDMERQQERMYGLESRRLDAALAAAQQKQSAGDVVAQHQKEREDFDLLSQGLGTGNKTNRDLWEKATTADAKFNAALKLRNLPVAQEQIMMMGQIIDSPNVSANLSKMKFLEQAAQTNTLDWLEQKAEKLSHNGTLTQDEISDLDKVFSAASQAQQQQYEKSVIDTISGVDLTDPRRVAAAAAYSGLPVATIERLAAQNGYELPAGTVPVIPFGAQTSSSQGGAITYGK